MSHADLETGTDVDVSEDLDDLLENRLSLIDTNPDEPTEAKPGSEEKVVMLAARYAAGLPLWHNHDCVDHGPESTDED
ncbi:MAG: hypothetical protein VB858_16740 [Planctomycetaceae bacterium]